MPTQLRAVTAARSRRSRLIAAAAAAGLLLAGSRCSCLHPEPRPRRRRGPGRRRHRQSARRGDLDQAASFLDNLEKADPGLLSEPSLIEVRQRIDAARKQETERGPQVRGGPARGRASPAGDPRAKGPGDRPVPGQTRVRETGRHRAQPAPSGDVPGGRARNRKRFSSHGSTRSIAISIRSASGWSPSRWTRRDPRGRGQLATRTR